MTTFSQVLREQSERTPDRVALTLLHAGKEDLPLTCRGLVKGSAAFAAAFASRGIQPGEVVILILQHGSDLIYSFFGAALAGCIPSIMPFLTEKLSPERYRADLAALIEITKPAAIVTYPEFEAEVRSALKEGDSVREVIVTGQMETAAEPDFAKLAGLQRSPDDIALLQHSSGTTGLQKGVALSHRAVFRQLEVYSNEIALIPQDVIVSWLPLYHDMGLIAGFLMPILSGVPLVLMSPFDWVRAPYRLPQAVSRYRGTLAWLPNFAYNFCAQKIRERDLQGVDLSCWRGVINCSEPARYESHKAFLQKFQPFGLRPEALMVSYAMAENVFAVTQAGVNSPVTIDEVDREALQVERVARPAAEGDPNRTTLKMVSTGKPIANTRVRVTDEHGHVLPERRVGEVSIQSDCMLTEIYHRPDLTQKALRGGWFLTGDFGYLADGELYITGRKKDLIIVGGKNIYPADLELLAMEVPGVHAGRVVAFGVFNEEQGTEEVFVAAESDDRDPAARQRMADAIRQVVTKGSAVALRHVHIVDPQWIIKTSSGKTSRFANRDKYLKEMSEK